jgi:hypothetical protein
MMLSTLTKSLFHALDSVSFSSVISSCSALFFSLEHYAAIKAIQRLVKIAIFSSL